MSIEEFNSGMCYNSHRDELFYLDYGNRCIVHSIHFHGNNRRKLVNVFKNESLIVCYTRATRTRCFWFRDPNIW